MDGWKFEKRASGLVVKSIMDPVATTRKRSASVGKVFSSSFHLLVQVGPTISGRLLYGSMRWLAEGVEVILH